MKIEEVCKSIFFKVLRDSFANMKYSLVFAEVYLPKKWFYNTQLLIVELKHCILNHKLLV